MKPNTWKDHKEKETAYLLNALQNLTFDEDEETKDNHPQPSPAVLPKPGELPHKYNVLVESPDKNEDFLFVQNRLESLRVISQDEPLEKRNLPHYVFDKDGKMTQFQTFIDQTEVVELAQRLLM